MDFLTIGPDAAAASVLLAHGAGAGMASKSLGAMAEALSGAGLRVVRFEFDYMSAPRQGRRRPPPRAETLIPEYLAAVGGVATRPLVIGGKSMGGRVASMVADELHAAGQIAGLLCLGYPFHPPGRPAQTRTRHLEHLQTPTMIFQGTRDPFGGPEDVSGYSLSPNIEICWLEDGDHDLKPRKRVSGLSADDHLKAMASRVATWAATL